MRKSLIPLGLLAAALMGSGGGTRPCGVNRWSSPTCPCWRNEYLIFHGGIVCRGD